MVYSKGRVNEFKNILINIPGIEKILMLHTSTVINNLQLISCIVQIFDLWGPKLSAEPSVHKSIMWFPPVFDGGLYSLQQFPHKC